jgi:hypothetical protein
MLGGEGQTVNAARLGLRAPCCKKGVASRPYLGVAQPRRASRLTQDRPYESGCRRAGRRARPPFAGLVPSRELLCHRAGLNGFREATEPKFLGSIDRAKTVPQSQSTDLDRSTSRDCHTGLRARYNLPNA